METSLRERILAVRRPVVVLAALVLFAVACGGGGESGAGTVAFDAATENQFTLELTGEITSSELLDVATGDKVSIETLIDGERPILAWFWAPH